MANYNFYKSDSKPVRINALVETAYESGEYVTFERRLNNNYGGYRDCVIQIPADLKPDVAENVYGERILTLDGLSASLTLAPSFAHQPIIRLPVMTVAGKLYAYVDLERRKYDDRRGEYVKTGKAIRAIFPVEG